MTKRREQVRENWILGHPFRPRKMLASRCKSAGYTLIYSPNPGKKTEKATKGFDLGGDTPPRQIITGRTRPFGVPGCLRHRLTAP